MWVLLDIDTQNDFMDPEGSLYLPGSEVIAPNLERLIAAARAHHIPIIATACAHRPDDPDPEPFPPHCLVGSWGQRRIGATDPTESVVLAPDDRLDRDGLPPHLTIEKRHYDVFTHPEADRIARKVVDGQASFIVAGVATDYCVHRAVAGLLDRGRRVILVVDAIRPVDPDAEPFILTDFARRGVLLTLTDVACALMAQGNERGQDRAG